jgi:hypothetical protein
MHKYKDLSVTRIETVLFVVSLLLAIATGLWWQSAANALKKTAFDHQNIMTIDKEKTNDIRVNQRVTADALKEMHDRAAAWESRLLKESQWEDFRKSLGTNWVFSQAEKVPDQNHTTLRGDLSFVGESIAEMPKITDVLERVEGLSPMVGVERMVIATDGDETNRHLSTVRFTITIPLHLRQ